MRFLLILTFIAYAVAVKSAQNAQRPQALTDSFGQEVIEIGTPVKELPPDLDEEPSAERDDDEDPPAATPKVAPKVTGTTVKAATKKPDAKASMTPGKEARRTVADNHRLDSAEKTEDDEARIEKELAQLYNDNADYSAEVTSKDSAAKAEKPKKLGEKPTDKPTDITSDETDDDKPALRAKANEFKFQPDLNNPKDIERFRTSVDNINCNQVTKKLTNDQVRMGNGSPERNLSVFIVSAVFGLSLIFK